MKINKLCALTLSMGILVSCSKLDESTRISKDMRDRSERMEISTNQLKQDSKAQAMLEDMRASLNHIRDTETLPAMSAEASIFFSYMPFQKIKLNASDREKYIKNSVTLFFLSPYNEYLPENNSVNPACDAKLEPVCDVEKRHRLTAFALASDILADEQKDFEGSNAQSFIAILIDAVKLGKKINDGLIDPATLSEHKIGVLNFETDIINFLQYVHNVKSIAAIKQIVDLDKLKKENIAYSSPDLTSAEEQKIIQMKKVQAILASVIMPKTAPMYKALKDIDTSMKIMVALSEVKQEIVYSEQVKDAYQLLEVLQKVVAADKKMAEMSVPEKNFKTLFNALERFSKMIK
ncbi:MAG: hypothetical protein A2381_05320 [Bdellovibrionales bacterium RIFOXYB1_FULL_37_110]|nr:MAG: hypothetical protein A2417_16800 [Bdellovibrionales bacterium RIFOXYC1_FULL_37_79]OFZ58166.1 MAG: hypothetical protein A2381_05320 [Bdellovibrionales bacterium RIFOXYB1_FULL_37_110]OFZ61855.1 MAG: hypothetical protein A2577_18905 [Bdellovibrionales bacterium RIFOXYD1_FULL_36_51]OGT97555.1 MAG: hypothetical protein A2298_05565 [Gammaproteobacteria bacterium RIFOXYB2_FULL_38_6]